MDRGAWWATVHGVTKIRTRLGDQTASVLRDLLRTEGVPGTLVFQF